MVWEFRTHCYFLEVKRSWCAVHNLSAFSPEVKNERNCDFSSPVCLQSMGKESYTFTFGSSNVYLNQPNYKRQKSKKAETVLEVGRERIFLRLKNEGSFLSKNKNKNKTKKTFNFSKRVGSDMGGKNYISLRINCRYVS